MGCGLVRESAGSGPRASLSAAVARNGPQAGPAEGTNARAPKQGALPKEASGCYQRTSSGTIEGGRYWKYSPRRRAGKAGYARSHPGIGYGLLVVIHSLVPRPSSRSSWRDDATLRGSQLAVCSALLHGRARTAGAGVAPVSHGRQQEPPALRPGCACGRARAERRNDLTRLAHRRGDDWRVVRRLDGRGRARVARPQARAAAGGRPERHGPQPQLRAAARRRTPGEH